jgi:DNA-binding NtrC family response regulator
MAKKLGRILVADDESLMLELFEETLGGDWEVRIAHDGREAEALLEREAFDLAFLDLRMPGRDGAELLGSVRGKARAPRVVIMSAHAGEERQRELLEFGAVRFLEKPFLPDVIEETARALLPASAERPLPELVIADPGMREVLATIDRIAPTRVTCLIQGETGTGKELLAHEIHNRSPRARRPFVRVNCAALAEGVLESELFGHERGSFTGAIRTTRGLFQSADGGTLLLDEISEISAPLQAKLLRVLQEREIRRVGGVEAIFVDARIVATTNRDLAAEVRRGRFRPDLYHRLNVLRIDVPPLRERPEDVRALSDHVLDRKAQEHEVPRPRLDTSARRALEMHDWPGNVRELENVLERALLLSQGGTITGSDLALEKGTGGWSAPRFAPGLTLREAERTLILETLATVRGNRTRAADMLGISVRTMRNKLHEYRRSGHYAGEEES